MCVVHYEKAKLVIEINAADPAALHAQLMTSLTSSITYCMQTPDKPKGFDSDMVVMLNLLSGLLPNEQCLR